MNFKVCAVIPVYNHHASLLRIAERLQACGLPCIFVDDGSDATTKAALRHVSSVVPGVECITLSFNRGKGAAIVAGFERAAALDYTHALQVDADGQHELDDVPALLRLAEQNPHGLISGLPVFDNSIPRVRFYGRYLTHVLVWVETLSLRLKDSMCGFRIYPLTSTLELIHRVRIGRRMDFDTDIMVRLYWSGIETLFLPTRVRYPEGGISHFRLFADNARMIWLHLRLLAGMLVRVPVLLKRKCPRRRARHWAQMPERGSALGIRFLGAIYAWFGRRVSHGVLLPVVAYFYVTTPSARRASRQFLTAVQPYAHGLAACDARPTRRNRFRHFWHYAVANLDMLAAWRDPGCIHLNFPDRGKLMDAIGHGRGMLLVSAHLGNLEVTRALASQVAGVNINALVYTGHAQKSNAALERTSAAYGLRLIRVQELGLDTIVMLHNKIAAGEVVVIVGDRTPVSETSLVVKAEFLGRPAPFAAGPWVLAHVLECPVYLFFCMAQDHGYTIYLEPFAERIHLPRHGRVEVLRTLVQRYAARLEDYAAQFPLQWYNFYDFWADRQTQAHSRLASNARLDTYERNSPQPSA